MTEMTEKIKTPEEIQAMEEAREKWDRLLNMPNCEKGEVVSVLRGYLEDDIFVNRRFNGQKLFNEIYSKIDSESFESLLEETERGVTRKKDLIKQFKRRFEEENKDGVVQKYIKYILTPSLDPGEYLGSYGNVIKNRNFFLERGDLSFLKILTEWEAESINEEFEELVTNINVEEIEKKEDEERRERNEERREGNEEKKAENKRVKKSLVNRFANEFERQRKLLQAMINYLNIRDGINIVNVGWGKKFKNFLNGFKLDDLRKISDLYKEIANMCRGMGGCNGEDDLLFVLEEFIESKEEVA